MVKGNAQLRTVVHHLGVLFFAVVGHPEDLVEEDDVVDCLILDVCIPCVRMLGIKGFTQAFGDFRSPLLGYGNPMYGPPFDPRCLVP